ncbi:MAG: TetR/AcrR family transcriptional regulator, partial [Mesorhizobium sp.]
MHRPRKEMIAETRAKLIAAARHAFGTVGYAESSMDDFTASAGLTRGALYHHFGDKKGLLQAVIAEIDGEMALRVNEVASKAPTRWQHFVDECTTYIEMALEPEIQRIMFRAGPAVLGDPAQWPNASACIASMTDHLTKLQEEGVVVTDVDPETTSRLINGASSQAAQRIANSNDPE